MSSRKDPQPIVLGGMEVLPPSDRIGGSASLVLDNFRCDQVGVLRSRSGSVKDAGPIGSGIFHSLYRSGDQRYGGIGTGLYHGGNLASTVATGFDGEPIDIAFMHGSGWAMNRGKRQRLDGATGKNWGIAAPGSAPTATANAQVWTNLENFEGSAGDVDVNWTAPDGITRALMTNDTPASTQYGETIVMAAGTIAFSQLDTAIVGTGTTFTAPMVGDFIAIQGFNPGFAIFRTKVASFTDATHITVEDPIDLFGSGAAIYSIYTVGASAAFDTANKLYGSKSLLIGAGLPGHIAVEINRTAVDTRTSGVANDDDVLRLHIRCTDASQITDLQVALADNSLGRFVETRFVAQGGAAAVLNQAPNAWTTLDIARVVNHDKWASRIAAADDPQIIADLNAQYEAAKAKPHFQNIGGGFTFVPFDWSAVTSLVVAFDVTGTPVQINVDDAIFIGIAGGGVNGQIQYYVSFGSATDESNLSPAATPVSVSNQSVALSSIPTSADAQVDRRYIYRSGGGLGAPMRVLTIGNNSATTATDTIANDFIQTLAIFGRTDYDLPPAARGVVGPFFGKLVAFSTSAHPSRYFWTLTGVPVAFPGSDDDANGNWEDAGGDEDEIITATIHGRELWFYRKRDIWRLAGDPNNTNPELTKSPTGIVGRRAVASYGQADYLFGAEGVYRFNGETAEKVPGLDPIFRGEYVQLDSATFLPPIASSAAALATVNLAIAADRLYVSYPESGSSVPTVTAVLNLTTGRWSRDKFNLTTFAPTAMFYEGAGFHLMGGFTTGGAGYLYQLEVGTGIYADDGNAVALYWQSHFDDQGLPDNYKRYIDIEIDYQTAHLAETPSTLAASFVYDSTAGGGTVLSLGNLNSASRTTATFRLTSNQEGGAANEGLRAKNQAIRITGNATSICLIYGVYVHWYVEERVAKSFDSGVIGGERVQQIDHLELEMTGTGQSVSRILSSDLPTRILTQRIIGNITATNGRGTPRERLSSIVEGRHMRLTLGSATAFQIHQARIRRRLIGEYIDGANGEYWESPEFATPGGGDGEIEDIRIDLDTAATGGTLKVYTTSDPPTANIAEVRSLALPNTSGNRRNYPFTMLSAGAIPHGSLWRVRITPGGSSIVRLHGRMTVRFRVYGVSLDGALGMRFTTQPLDLFGGMSMMREVLLVAQGSGTITVNTLTELPDSTMASVQAYTFTPSSTTTGRKPEQWRLPPTTRGKLQQFIITASGTCRLIEMRVYGRALGNIASSWSWKTIPMEQTADELVTVNVAGIHQTEEEFTWAEIPVDAIG